MGRANEENKSLIILITGMPWLGSFLLKLEAKFREENSLAIYL